MGCWNETCMITQLPILSSEKVVLFILKNNEGTYSPLSLPIIGEYDDYGRLENIEDSQIHYELLNKNDDFKDFNSIYEIINYIERHCNQEDLQEYGLSFIHYDVFVKMTTYSSNKYSIDLASFYKDFSSTKKLNFVLKENNKIFFKERIPNNLFLEIMVIHYYEYQFDDKLRNILLYDLYINKENDITIQLLFSHILFNLLLIDSRKKYQVYNEYSGSQKEVMGIHSLIADFVKEKTDKKQEERLMNLKNYAENNLTEIELEEEINLILKDFKEYQE